MDTQTLRLEMAKWGGHLLLGSFERFPGASSPEQRKWVGSTVNGDQTEPPGDILKFLIYYLHVKWQIKPKIMSLSVYFIVYSAGQNYLPPW